MGLLAGREGSRGGQTCNSTNEAGRERTRCLSHTGRRATGLRVGGVGLGARKVVLVGGRASGRRVQPVLRLRGVRGRNIGGSNLGLRRVLHVGWGVVSRGSSRSLVCRRMFRRCVGDGRVVVRT